MIPAEAILEETRRTLSRLHPHEAAWLRWIGENVFEPLGDLVQKIFGPLFDLSGTLAGKIALGVLVAAAVALLVLLARLVFRRGQERARSRAADRAARSSPLLRDPDEAERDAARLAREGRFTEAVRLLYLATFVRLHRRSGRPFDPSLTPGENLRAFRGEPWFQRLREFVGGYQAASFGEAPLDDPSYRSIEGLRPPEGTR